MIQSTTQAPEAAPQPPEHFQAPWQAQAFAMTLALHQRGLFSWAEWAQALSSAIQSAQDQGDPDFGDTYYEHWMSALESLVASKGLSSAEELSQYRHAWDQAAHRTPHGHSIELKPQDFEAPQEPTDRQAL